MALNINQEKKKLQQEIESMQFKKQSLISTVQGEIQAAKQRINNVMLVIGQDVYANHTDGVDIEDKLKAHFNEIETQKGLIAEKEAKTVEIAKRYDDELSMLIARLNTMQPPPPPQNMPMQPPPPQNMPMQPPPPQGNAQMAGGGAFCPKCGRPYVPGVSAFCVGCGTKL